MAASDIRVESGGISIPITVSAAGTEIIHERRCEIVVKLNRHGNFIFFFSFFAEMKSPSVRANDLLLIFKNIYPPAVYSPKNIDRHLHAHDVKLQTCITLCSRSHTFGHVRHSHTQPVSEESVNAPRRRRHAVGRDSSLIFRRILSGEPLPRR